MNMITAASALPPKGARVVHINDHVPGAVYIGCAVPRRGVEGSIWGNPHRMGNVITDYRRDLVVGRLRSRLARLPELRGKPLACWCRHDGQTSPSCHGDVLIALLDRYTDAELRAMALP